MNFCFITSGHDPFDDRIFYHMATSLVRLNHSVIIISSTENIDDTVEGVILRCFSGQHLDKKSKLHMFTDLLSGADPDVIICSEPLPLYAAGLYRKKSDKKLKVIYDVTEWYPSGKNLRIYNNAVKWIHFFRLFTFGFIASMKADAFIFGEYYKSLPYRLLFFHKPFEFISYYPDIDQIPENNPTQKHGIIRLLWSGKISREKGHDNFIRVIRELARKRPDLKISVRVIGWNDPDSREDISWQISDTENVSFEFHGKLHFREYLQRIRDTDIFLDLRSPTPENSHSLPIRLFYFAALGRPVIMSRLKAISRVMDITPFGYLVNPESAGEISNLIIRYHENPELYSDHCMKARQFIVQNHNWKIQESRFIRFVTSG